MDAFSTIEIARIVGKRQRHEELVKYKSESLQYEAIEWEAPLFQEGCFPF